MTVYRTRELPVAPARGHLVVARAVVAATQRRLLRSRGADGRHEGLLLWIGRIVGNDTIVVSSVAPTSKHTWGSVNVDEIAVGAAARAARSRRLGVVAQVHSHPGDDVRHSDGDDDLVLLPFEGMFSLVIANYGMAAIASGPGVGVHQFQDGRWTWIDPVRDALHIVEEEIG